MPAGFTGTVLSTGSIIWQWQNSIGEAGDQVYSSTSGQVSSTLASNTTTWVEGGLAPNTTYYNYVEAFNGANMSSSSLAGVLTYAAAVTPSIVSVSSNSISVGIQSNGNPAGTLYAVELLYQGTTYYLQANGTPGSTAVFQSTQTWGGTTINAANLQVNATYYFAVAAMDYLGRQTAYSSYISTCTSAQIPVVASYLFIETQRISVFLGTFNNPSGTLYNVEASTDPAFGVIAGSSSWMTNNNYIFSGLIPNTTYYFKAQAMNSVNAITTFSALNSVATAVNYPQYLTTVSVSSGSVSISWDPNSNSPLTNYDLEGSADNVNWASIYTGPLLAFTTAGLSPNTLYYYRARAQGLTGAYSFYTDVIDTSTYASMASVASLTSPSSTSISLTINTNGNSAGTLYGIEVLSGGNTYYLLQDKSLGNSMFYSGAVYQSISTWGSPIVMPNLNPNIQYGFAVDAMNLQQVDTGFSAQSSTYTLAQAPGAQTPTPISTSQITASWATGVNPSATQYEVDLSTSLSFAVIQSSSNWQTGISAYTFGPA